MKIKIREATSRDRGLFLKLLKAFMEYEYNQDPDSLLPSENNIDLLGQYFDAYVNGDLEGVILFFRENAFCMYGDQGSAFEFRTKRAMSFAVYVDEEFRGQGIAQALRSRGLEVMKQMGFDEVYGVNMLSNEKAVESSKASGFSPTAYMVKCVLKEEKD